MDFNGLMMAISMFCNTNYYGQIDKVRCSNDLYMCLEKVSFREPQRRGCFKEQLKRAKEKIKPIWD